MKKTSCLLLMALLMPTISFAANNAVLPEKTRITLQLNDKLSTRVNSEGDAFTAYVTAPVLHGDTIAIPKGSVVTGSISRIIRPGRFKGKAVLNILFQAIEIPGRGQMPIAASLTRLDAEGNGGIHPEGTVVGKRSEGNDIGRIVMPGVVGAGVGTLAGGGRGAAVGGGVGAAIGLAAVFATRGEEIEIPRGSTLDITLDKPLAIPLEEDGPAVRR